MDCDQALARLIYVRGRSVREHSTLSVTFNCPSCDALYQVVKAEAGPETAFADVSCRVCGEPLAGRKDQFVLKNFSLAKARRFRIPYPLERSPSLSWGSSPPALVNASSKQPAAPPNR